jgi:hypothetical protein
VEVEGAGCWGRWQAWRACVFGLALPEAGIAPGLPTAGGCSQARLPPGGLEVIALAGSSTFGVVRGVGSAEGGVPTVAGYREEEGRMFVVAGSRASAAPRPDALGTTGRGSTRLERLGGPS